MKESSQPMKKRRRRAAAGGGYRASPPARGQGVRSVPGTARAWTIDTPPFHARFYHGDCIRLLPRILPPASVDVIVTSPPYNLGIRYREYDDSLPRARYLNWIDRWARVMAALLSPHGSFFLNVGSKPSDPWIAQDVARVVRKHLRLQNTIHWIKSIAIDRDAAGAGVRLEDDLAVGHYKPINSDRYLNDCHEFVFHFTPHGATRLDRRAIGVRYQDKSNIGRWKAAANGLRCRGNTWFIPYETIQSRDRERPHPATFPPRLPERCIRLHGLPQVRLVVDPFLGIGNTAVACARLGVPFVGVDVDASYVQEAVRRVRVVAAEMPDSTEKGLSSPHSTARLPFD